MRARAGGGQDPQARWGPSQPSEGVAHRVDLVVVNTGREAVCFANELLDPCRGLGAVETTPVGVRGTWKVDVAGLDLRGDRVCALQLAPDGLDRDDRSDLTPEDVDHRLAVGCPLNEDRVSS